MPVPPFRLTLHPTRSGCVEYDPASALELGGFGEGRVLALAQGPASRRGDHVALDENFVGVTGGRIAKVLLSCDMMSSDISWIEGRAEALPSPSLACG